MKTPTNLRERQLATGAYDPETGSEYKRAHGFNITTKPHMLSCEMQSINRAFVASKPKPKVFELIQDAQDAIGRAQTLIVDHPNDPNAAMLELNEAYGLIETLYSNASIEVLETHIL